MENSKLALSRRYGSKRKRSLENIVPEKSHFQLMRNFRKNRKLLQIDPPLVAPSKDFHATLNPGFVCYSGQEFVSRDLTDFEIRAKALQALDDMEERFDTDFPKLNPKKFMPGAMGIQIIEGKEPEPGYHVYYHSNMKQKTRPDYNSEDVQLAEEFQDLVIVDDKTVPVHRRAYRCTEPGLFTNSRTTNPGSSSGSRIYIIDRNGQSMPPCGSNISHGADRIGCHHFVETAEAKVISDGAAGSYYEGGVGYYWYGSEQVRPPISCRMMGSRMAARLASQIASEIVEERADRSLNTALSQVTPPAPLQEDLEFEHKIRAIARELTRYLSQTLDEKLARRMTNRLHFSDAHKKVDEAIDKLDANEALMVAQKVQPDINSTICAAIYSKVITEVAGWAAGQLAVKPIIRSMKAISFDDEPHPLERMTNEECRAFLRNLNQEPPDFFTKFDGEMTEAYKRGEPMALPRYIMDETEQRRKECKMAQEHGE